MNLSEIIQNNNKPQTAIEYGTIHPYLRSMYVFYKDLYLCEPVLMVCSITNNSSYVKIVSSNEFTESICDYIGCEIHELQNSDDYLSEFETINFCSKMLKECIK
jgi:hypothetical protein